MDDPRPFAPKILPRPLARRGRVEGSVILMIVIDADGRIGEGRVIRSGDQRWGSEAAERRVVEAPRRPGRESARRDRVTFSAAIVNGCRSENLGRRGFDAVSFTQVA